jgi:BASS family bile acid:Na+ symporter
VLRWDVALGGYSADRALRTAQRNIAAVLAVGSHSCSDPKVVVMVVVAIVVLLVLLPLSRMLAMRGADGRRGHDASLLLMEQRR